MEATLTDCKKKLKDVNISFEPITFPQKSREHSIQD
jgi:hypothetical protein